MRDIYFDDAENNVFFLIVKEFFFLVKTKHVFLTFKDVYSTIKQYKKILRNYYFLCNLKLFTKLSCRLLYILQGRKFVWNKPNNFFFNLLWIDVFNELEMKKSFEFECQNEQIGKSFCLKTRRIF